MVDHHQDHDLLIQINTKLERVITDVKELKDNVAARVAALEQEKINKEEVKNLNDAAQVVHKDLGDRVRILERWGLISMGFLYAIQAYFEFFK